MRDGVLTDAEGDASMGKMKAEQILQYRIGSGAMWTQGDIYA